MDQPLTEDEMISLLRRAEKLYVPNFANFRQLREAARLQNIVIQSLSMSVAALLEKGEQIPYPRKKNVEHGKGQSPYEPCPNCGAGLKWCECGAN